ncbi:T9SS type A sorting domain-containing protein [Polaribacter vadi]|uniref:T9SS type A sorting domain-containing protein n=1 Tax=Polaribacter vadi TaxID=1774273 RepID=UPI0030EF0B9F|tara:strand:+ start:53484 stop:56042 length:2559 start_codon:yes stop_codon:yes gene_type:complete
MKKHLLKIFNKKILTLALLAFVGFGSFQMNGQTELTVADVVAVETFTVQNGGDLDDTIGAITAGTGSVGGGGSFIQISSDALGVAEPYTSTDDVQGTFTFTVRSTAVDVTADITLSFRKRKGNSVAGSIDVAGVTGVETFSEASENSTNQALGDFDVVLSNVALTTTPQTIVVNLTSLLRGNQESSHDPVFRFDGVSINKTAVACTTPEVVTTLSASAGAEYINLSWVDPTCFDEVLVVAKEGSAVTVTPTGDGSSYTANATFGSGTDLGTSEFSVFKGTANNVIVKGLTKGGTTYHFKVFTRKGTDWSTGVTGNATTNNTYISISGANNAGLNWEDASSWIGAAVPSATSDDVIINTGLIINSDVVLNDIVIESRITVTEGFSIKANDLNQNSQLIVKSTSSAFGSVIVNTLSGTGDLIYDRWLNDSPNNDLISSPVSGVTFSSVATNNNNDNKFFRNPSDDTNYFFGPFDNTSGLYETYSTGTDDAVVIVTGKGYRAATSAGGAQTVRFAGAIEVGSVPVTITDGGDATYGQWNLIGNPYPSYLDFGAFFTTNSGEFHLDNVAVYGWNGTDYTVWNGANSSDKLAPGQGFFVRTKDGITGNVDFTTAMRTTGNTNDFVAKSANTKKALAKINLSNSEKSYSTNIYFIENQTRGLDFGYDAGAFSGSADGIYTNLVENNTGLALAIQSLSYTDFNNVVVPVAINSDAGVELTISLDAASLTIPSDTYVYLKDNLLNTTTLLNDADYVFTPDTKLNSSGRFFIEFSSKAALATDDYAVNEMLIYTNQESKSIIIKGILKTATSAKVFDIQGRMVLEQKLDSSNITNVVNANALNTGVYIIQLEGKTQKVIIK